MSMKPGEARVIATLGTAQTLAWASSYYLAAILANPIPAELQLGTPWVFLAFSSGLLAFLCRALLSLPLPVWNDLWGYGFPGLAESQMGVYYPPHWLLYGLLPLEWAYTASLVLHTLLGGLGTYWCSRRFGVSPAPPPCHAPSAWAELPAPPRPSRRRAPGRAPAFARRHHAAPRLPPVWHTRRR